MSLGQERKISVKQPTSDWIADLQLSKHAQLLGLNVLILLGAGLIWQLVAFIYQSPFIPGPISVFKASLNLILNGDIHGQSLLIHINASLGRVLAGFAIAIFTGVPLGIFMGLYPRVRQACHVLIEPLRFIPPLAWIPMALVILTGFSRYAFIIWLGAFFPIFLATMVGIPRVDPLHINVARIHGASRGWIIRKVIIPSILPDIFGGMRVGLGIAWMCIVAAEMIGGGTTGLGKFLIEYAELLRMPEIIVGMAVIGLTGFVMNEVLLRIEKRLFAWREEVEL